MILRNKRWTVLAVLAIAQFMVVLDVTIVNVALPKVQHDLRFSSDSLQWVVNSYTLMAGGLLLLGGRLGDHLGRRRMFVVGLTLFTLSSLAAGLADSSGELVAARIAQGIGSALLSPAALSLLTMTYAHGRERNIAVGVWGALGGLGGTLGVVLGGALIAAASWRLVFFVNVPFGAALVLLAPRLIGESRFDASERAGGFDVTGALLGTGGLLALVYGVVRSQPLGWGSTEVLAALGAAMVLLAGFVLVELRAKSPLLSPRLLAPHQMRSATLAIALNGATFLGMFYLTSIYIQEVRGRSALMTGVEVLPMGIAAIIAAGIASTVVTRSGPRPVRIVGALLSAIGLLILSRVTATSAYLWPLLPGMVLFGIGMISLGTASQIAATATVRHEDAGAVSGIINTSYQVGCALGLAVITTFSSSRATDLLHAHATPAVAMTGGFQRGMLVAAAAAALNLLLALRARPLRLAGQQLVAEPQLET